MDNTLQPIGILNDQIEQAFRRAVGQWKGCDWKTEYGPSRLNLIDMRAPEAMRIAQATSGGEAANWHAAFAWLCNVEADATKAENEARCAVALVRTGRIVDALTHAERACILESRYRETLVWGPLRDALAAVVYPQTPNTAHGASLPFVMDGRVSALSLTS